MTLKCIARVVRAKTPLADMAMFRVEEDKINTTNTITRFKYYLEKELHEIQRCDFQNYNKDTEFLAPNFFYSPD